MIAKKPDFFRRDFLMHRRLFCTECNEITPHQIQVLKDSPEDGGVPCLKTCHVCWDSYQKLLEIGIDKGKPVFFQRFLTQPYVYLVLHPAYLE